MATLSGTRFIALVSYNMYSLFISALLVAQAVAGYHGPEAKPVVKADGFLADTHDVAAAKNLHLGALSQASHHGGDDDGSYHHAGAGENSYHHGDEGHQAYHGPIAVPKVLPDGHLADTHEVSAAKSAHFAALAKAKSGHPGDHHDSQVHHESQVHHDDHHQQSYHGPLAKPVVLPSGHLADTHEVAAAKGAHLDALAQAHH